MHKCQSSFFLSCETFQGAQYSKILMDLFVLIIIE
jgi:hypothetical protein